MLNFLMKNGGVEVTFGNLFKGSICAVFEQMFHRLMGTLYQVLGLFADLLHIAFYILAGVDMKAGNNNYGMFDIELISTGSRQNILDYFVFNESVTKAYWILCGIGLLLIVVFTVYKIVKQDYFDRAGPRSKGPIFRNVAISAISFLLVIPIFYVIIHVSSLLAVAVMDAMGMNATTFAGAQIFQLSWSDNGEAMRLVNSKLLNFAAIAEGKEGVYSDTTFKWMLELDSDTIFIFMASETSYVDFAPNLLAALGVDSWSGGIVTHSGTNAGDVSFYWYIYLVGVIVGIKSLYKLLQAMLQRIFKILGLFIVAPSPISQYVLDDGAKFQSWLKQSIQEGLRLVVATLSFSIFLMVLKLVSDINFITPFKDAANAATQAESINVSADLLVYNEEFANVPMLGDPGASGTNALESAFYSLANAFMQVFMIMGAGGAITDLDPLLSGLISGAGSSLEAGKTGEGANAVAKAATGLATRAAGAAMGGALSVAKGAAGLAVGGVANAVKGSLEGRRDRLEEAAKDDEGTKDEDNKEETSTATVESENTSVADNAGGNDNEEKDTEGVDPTAVDNPDAEDTGDSEEENAENVEENQDTKEATDGATNNKNKEENGDDTGDDNPVGENKEKAADGNQTNKAAQSGDNAKANNAATKQGGDKSTNGNKSSSKGDPKIIAKRQARLKRINGVLKAGHLAKSGLKRTFGVAGGFLKALNLKQALVDSGLVSKEMADNFGTARTTAQSAMDSNVVKPAVDLAKEGISKASHNSGQKAEQKKMDRQIEKTEVAKKHKLAMQNVDDRTKELQEANADFAAASNKEKTCASQYGSLVEEQVAAEETAAKETSNAQINYATANANATLDQKEKLNKYINGEISEEEAGSDLKAFKAAGADKAREATAKARKAADAAENGEYVEQVVQSGTSGGVETIKVLNRAGKKQYDAAYKAKEAAQKKADMKLTGLNSAVSYANKTSKEYNDLYTSTKTRGNDVKTDKKTGEKTIGIKDVSKGKLGKANAKLAAAGEIASGKTNVAQSITSSAEGAAKQIEILKSQNSEDEALLEKYNAQESNIKERVKEINSNHDDSIGGMSYEYKDEANGGNIVEVKPSEKIITKLDKKQTKQLKKTTNESKSVAKEKEVVEKRIAARNKRIEKLERVRGLSSPAAVMDTLNSQIGSLETQMMEMKNNPYYQSDEVAYNDAKRNYQASPTPENKARYEAQKEVHDARVKKYDDMKRRKDALVATKKSMENIENEPEQNERKIQALDGKIADKRVEETELAKKDAQLAKKQEKISAAANPVNDKYNKLAAMRTVLDSIERGESVSPEQLEEFNSLNLPGGAKKIGGAIKSVQGHVGKREELQTELHELHESGKGTSKGKGLKLTKDLESVNNQIGGEVQVLRTAIDKEMTSTSNEIKGYTTQMYETEKERKSVEAQKAAVQTSIKGYENEQEQLRVNTKTTDDRLQKAAAIGASVAGYNYNPKAETQSEDKNAKSVPTQANANNSKNATQETTTKVREKEKVVQVVTEKAEKTAASQVRDSKSESGVKIDRGEWSEGAKVMADEISDAVASAAKKVLSGETGAGRDTGLGAASAVNNINQNVTVNNGESKNTELKGSDANGKYEEEDHVMMRNVSQEVDEINQKLDDEE